MPIARERFEAVKRAWGHVGSWAVWADALPGEGVKAGVGDLSVLDPDANPDLLQTLNPDVVMLGINGSGASTPDAFSNFHDASPRANRFKLRHAYRGTPYWGAYLTETFKGLPSSSAQSGATSAQRSTLGKCVTGGETPQPPSNNRPRSPSQ